MNTKFRVGSLEVTDVGTGAYELTPLLTLKTICKPNHLETFGFYLEAYFPCISIFINIIHLCQ